MFPWGVLLVQAELVSVFRGTTTEEAFRNRFIFVCACMPCLYVCFSTVWMSGVCKAKDEVWSFGAGVKDGCESPRRCWGLNLGLLIMLLNTEQFLQLQDPPPCKRKVIIPMHGGLKLSERGNAQGERETAGGRQSGELKQHRGGA